MWEDNGFVMYYKALAEEKFKWLLDGYDISLFKGHKKPQYDSLGWLDFTGSAVTCAVRLF